MQEVNNTETQQQTASFVQESNVVETTQTNLNTDKPKQNSFLITLLSILLLLSCIIAGYFAYQTQTLVKELTTLKNTSEPTPTATSLPTEIPTATGSAVVTGTENWKTYSNAKYGYSIKVPNYLVQLQDNRGGVLSINDTDWRFGKTDMSKVDEKHKTIAQNAISLFVSVFDENVSVENYDLTCQSDVLGFNINKPVINKKPINPLFTKYIEYSGLTAYDTQQDVPWWSSNLCFMYKNNFYHVNYQNFESTDKDITFDQILSTFKFTN